MSIIYIDTFHETRSTVVGDQEEAMHDPMRLGGSKTSFFMGVEKTVRIIQIS